VRAYLGIDGGGTKTAFLLIDESGRVLASHHEGSAYYFETGWDPMREMLSRGIHAVLNSASVTSSQVDFAFVGLPTYGEDSRLIAAFDALPSPPLQAGRFRCGNDAICGWAGALAAQDGINIVAGTGSIAYGEYNGRSARAGGWGELFSDEGSAYWVAREGLTLFSRMSDGRAPRGPLYEMVRSRLSLTSDLDLCAAIYSENPTQRSQLASWAALVSQAATAGDVQADAIFERAADELLQMIAAVHNQLSVPASQVLPVSYSGGLFNSGTLQTRLSEKLAQAGDHYRLVIPRLPPVAGAALYAAKLSGTPLGDAAIERLQESCRVG
jgi:N-acetylglucosamine kinase-like BadF-type ATPase